MIYVYRLITNQLKYQDNFPVISSGPVGSQTIMSDIKIPRSHTQDKDLSFFFFKDFEFSIRKSLKVFYLNHFG